MRYVQLRAFHHVAICGGFSRAAEALHLTQPAISDQVRKLETEYDTRLFNRRRKQVTLTHHGRKLLDITRRLFEIEEQAFEFLSQSQALKTGRLNIIADSTHHILPALALFREKYPAIFVRVRGGNTPSVINSLYSYEADIGVLGEVPESRDFEVIGLNSTPIIAFTGVGSSHARDHPVSFAEIAQMPLVMRESGSKTRAKLEEHAAQTGVKLNIAIEAEGREAIREIVGAEGGVGFVSEAEFGADPRFVKIPLKDTKLMMDEAVICLRERLDSRLIRAFMPLARKAAEA